MSASSMDLGPSEKGAAVLAELQRFMDEHVYPAEAAYMAQRVEQGMDNHQIPPVVETLKAEARSRGLWNLYLPAVSGLSNLDYCYLAELTGRSPYIAPQVINSNAPDSGNVELLHKYGSEAQKRDWMDPVLDGTMRSAFAMTEPQVASSDATNIRTSIVRDGDEYVVNGRKWWTSGLADPRCAFMIVMGKTDPDGPKYRQQSMIIVPVDTPGVQVLRSLTVFGFHDQFGHGEVVFDDVRVPAGNLIGSEGDGFAIAQGRLGPGRLHHAMRSIGMAERALEMMVDRVSSRVTFGRPLSEQGVVRNWIAESRMEIEQARLLVLKCAWIIDSIGVKAAQTEVAAIKVVAPRVAQKVIDRAIQAHGGGGVSEDYPLARMWATARILSIADGPDEVHLRSVARVELAKRRAAVSDGSDGSDGSATPDAGA